MKKLLLLVAVTASFTFASCKKNYTCTCKDNSGFSASVTIHDTKKKATAACTADASAYAGSGITCSIN